MRMRTTGETIHGNPGERRALPAGVQIDAIPASNLPDDSRIRYWAHPRADGTDLSLWPAETLDWAEGVGCGLYAEDVE
jgi:hypothetical protein